MGLLRPKADPAAFVPPEAAWSNSYSNPETAGYFDMFFLALPGG
jgi:hypothetical protein